MTKIKTNLNIIIALVAISATIGCTSVRQVGSINGLSVHRVTARGVFSPSTTTLVLSDPAKPGTIDSILANASGQGLLPAVANAAGVVGGAALLRPDRTNVHNESNGGDSAATGGAGGTAVGGTGYGGITTSTAVTSSQSSAYSQSDAWAGVIGSGNVNNHINNHTGPANNNSGNNGNGGNPHN